METKQGAFITDFGKVLVDYNWYPFFQKLSWHTGRPVEDCVKRFLGSRQQEISKQFCEGQIGSGQFYRDFCSALGIGPEQLSFQKFEEFFNSTLTGEIPGIIELLPMFKEKFGAMIMITNINDLHFNFAQQTMPRVFEPFDFVIASHKVGLLKPAVGIYNLAIEFIRSRGLRPEDSLFVDDIQANLDGAQTAGIGHVFQFLPDREAQFNNYLKNRWEIKCG